MISKPEPKNVGRYVLLIFLLIIFVLFAVAIVPLDQHYSLLLREMSWPAFEDFYSRTLFEGDLPGASDISIIGILICLFFYVRSTRNPKRTKIRAELGFAIFGALISAVCFVNSTKWIIGRARPKEVVKKGLEYSDWFSFGPHYISEGIYRGSFPSGHTLAALLPLLLAYALAGNRENSSRVKLTGVIVGALALANAGLMAIARPMALAHWISDGLLGLLIGWILIHICYYWILKVPEQKRLNDFAAHGSQLPSCWELVLGLWSLGFCAGLTLALLGGRSLLHQESLFFALLIPPGILLSGISAYYWGHLYRRFLKLCTQQPESPH
jgi:membrane-associated phospholipid phosphatase